MTIVIYHRKANQILNLETKQTQVFVSVNAAKRASRQLPADTVRAFSHHPAKYLPGFSGYKVISKHQ